jgi:hypothetical protein
LPRKISNTGAIEKTIRALEDAGRLSDEDQAIVALARCLAAALDAEPENAALAREYRAALVALSVAGADRPDDDARDFLLTIRTPRPALGDVENTEP